MLIKQISVFVENTTGRLAKLTKVLEDANIDIVALSIADTVDFGILRCIVSDPDRAAAELKKNGFTASITKVIAVEVDDVPGGLAKVLAYMAEDGVGVDYIYSFIRSHEGTALILFKVSDSDKAIETLTKHSVPVLCQSDINAIKGN